MPAGCHRQQTRGDSLKRKERNGSLERRVLDLLTDRLDRFQNGSADRPESGYDHGEVLCKVRTPVR